MATTKAEFSKMRLASAPSAAARDALPKLSATPQKGAASSNFGKGGELSPRSLRMLSAAKSGRRMSLGMRLDAARAGLIPTMSKFEVDQHDSRTASGSGLRLDLELKNEEDSRLTRDGRREAQAAKAVARTAKDAGAKQRRQSMAAMMEAQRSENTMSARLARRSAAEQALVRRAELEKRLLAIVLLCSRAQAGATKIAARHAGVDKLAHSHAAKTIVRVLRAKLWRRSCTRASDLLVRVLRDRRQMLFATLAYKAWLLKIQLVQGAWRRKGMILHAQVQLLANVCTAADEVRVEQEISRLQKKDRAWVKAENEHVLHFNQHHTGRIAGAQSIERQPRVEELPLEKVKQQVCYFTLAQRDAALRRVLLRRQLRFLRAMRLASQALWPQFVQLVRDDNVSMSRAEVQNRCASMRARNEMMPFMVAQNALMDVTVDGMQVPVPEPLKRVPPLDELVKLQQEEAQLLVPELGKRQSTLPSWYLEDIYGKQDRPGSRQKGSRRRTGRPGSSAGAKRRTSVSSRPGSKGGSRPTSGKQSSMQSAMNAATDALGSVAE